MIHQHTDLNDNLRIHTLHSPAFQRSKDGELKEVHGLDAAGRTVYVKIKDFPATLESLVKQGDHVFLGTTSVMATLLAQSFSRTGLVSS